MRSSGNRIVLGLFVVFALRVVLTITKNIFVLFLQKFIL